MMTSPAKQSFFVRFAKESDARAIFLIVSASMKSYSAFSKIPDNVLDASNETEEDIRCIIKKQRVYVAVDCLGVVAGTFRLIFPNMEEYKTHVSDLPAELSEIPVAYFSRFSVALHMQNRGVGNLLLLAAEKEARMQGANYLLLHTALSHMELVSFYQKRGFVLLDQNDNRGYARGLFGKQIR